MEAELKYWLNTLCLILRNKTEMELFQMQKSKHKWHYIFFLYEYINFRSYCSIIRGSETEVPLFSTSKEMKIIAILLLHKLRPKFSTSGSIHCDCIGAEMKAISSCWQFICLVELYLTSDVDVQRSTKYRNFTGCCHRTHTVRNAANSTAVAITAILPIVADVIIWAIIEIRPIPLAVRPKG